MGSGYGAEGAAGGRFLPIPPNLAALCALAFSHLFHTWNLVNAGKPNRFGFCICPNPPGKVTVWGSCEGLVRRDSASVNYTACTLPSSLVPATGKKSSFGGSGEYSN